MPPLKAKEGEGASGSPAPARGENRRGENGLLENFLDGCGVEEMENVGERKTVLIAERNVEAVVRGGGLQFEIE